jgi:hypothetical protein
MIIWAMRQVTYRELTLVIRKLLLTWRLLHFDKYSSDPKAAQRWTMSVATRHNIAIAKYTAVHSLALWRSISVMSEALFRISMLIAEQMVWNQDMLAAFGIIPTRQVK